MNPILETLLGVRQAEGAIPFKYRVTSNSMAQQAGTEAAPTGTDIQPLTLDNDSFFFCTGFGGTSSRDSATAYYNNNFSVKVACTSMTRNFSTVRIPQKVFAGSTFGNLFERRCILFPPEAVFEFDFANLSTAGTNIVNFYLHGYKIKKPSNKMLEEHHISKISDFFYLIRTLDASGAGMAGNGANTQSMQFNQDSWFELHSIMAYGSVDAATDYMPNNFSCQITNVGSGEKWANTKIEQKEIATNIYAGQFERIPYLIAPNATLQFDFNNLSGSTNIVTLVAKGYKHYK